MKRCVIIGAAPVADSTYMHRYILPDDYIVAADGGVHTASALGLTPHLTVADNDSSSPSEQAEHHVALPVEKDDTDTAVAMQTAFDAGAREFLLLGCLGGRFDHSIANILNARRFAEKGAKVTLADEKNEMTVLLPGKYTLATGGFSIFAMTETVNGVCLSGVQYPLQDFTLSSDNPLCVSNRALSAQARLSFDTGVLLCIFAKD